jgi:aspartate/methionine/tyrosine aminotransferase
LPDSWAFAEHLMQHAHVALTPGRDFGTHAPGDYVRFSTASSLQDLQTAAKRIQNLLEAA